METKRLYYIDKLRVLVVLSLIPFHASLTYLRLGTVYIKAPVSGISALPFLFVNTPLSDFFMTLLFFISGIASYYSFKKRGSREYMRERIKKLFVPFILGFLLLCPITGYMKALYEGFEGGFLRFIPQFFWYKIFYYLGYGHLWFLLYLFIFSMICVPLLNWLHRDENRIDRIAVFITKGHRLLLCAGWIILLELCLRPFFNSDQTFIMDWANDTVYLSVFIFGYLFAADERIREKMKVYFKPSMIFAALSLAVLFYVNIMAQVYYSSEIYLLLLWVFFKGIYECSAIIFLINLGWKYFNTENRFFNYLSGASFTVYIFHFLPVTFFTLLFNSLKIHNVVKFLMVNVLSYLFVFLVYEIWRRLPILRPKLKKAE